VKEDSLQVVAKARRRAFTAAHPHDDLCVRANAGGVALTKTGVARP
jgi:hypothetical protein